MPDGVRLAVNLLTSSGWRTRRSPVILEYLPYRKDDWSAESDIDLHSFWVRQGYVVARVDVRGTGRSQGHLPDREYSDQELQDGDAVIAWLAKQSWSNGSVGMMGISWGGFNSIQMAMRRPPALKALIAVCATDDLFKDDIHYIDGLMHADEFELAMDLQTMMTRAPRFPLDEASLHQRFDADPWFLLYLQHQRGGPFWDRASLRPDYSRIQIPVFVIGGFDDGYRDSIPRMLENLAGPRRGLIGPWNHSYPHEPDFGPAVEWRDITLRWWDHWLKGTENGVEKEPMLTAYLRHSYLPSLDIKEIPGEWRSFDSWPVNPTQQQLWFLNREHGLGLQPSVSSTDSLRYEPSSGIEAGFWWGELAVDQRPLDAMGLVYDSVPLENGLAILGEPIAHLLASSSAPVADWMVRLEDIAPTGEATLITGAGLSGAQRESMRDPTPLTPGQRYPLTVQLHFTSWVFPKGHRIRVAVSNALWPMIWPTPFAMTTDLAVGGDQGSTLTLPVLQSPGNDAHFNPPIPDPKLPGYGSEGETWPGGFTMTRNFDEATNQVKWSGSSKTTLPWGEEDSVEKIAYDVIDSDPAKSSMHGEASTTVKLKSGTITWSVVLDLKSDQQNFYYTFTRRLTKGKQLLRTKTWKQTIPRDLQ